tara:strand:- start:125 stop:577 length:453 start_codon:yes stop_codon:yes gene_type:complete
MNLLEQIFTNGYAVEAIDLAEGKIKAEVKNLAADEQIDIEGEISELQGKSSAYVLHQYSLKILEKTLIRFNGKTFKDEKDCRALLGTLPTEIVDTLIKEQNRLEKKIAKEINPEAVDSTFFETGSTQEGSGPTPAASSSEKEGASEKQSS